MSSNTLEINGKSLQPIKDAADSVSYSRDYVARLAREGKIVASHIGRQWYIDLDSLQHYEKISQAEKEIRKRQLSEERKLEKKSKEVKSNFNNLAAAKAVTFKTRAAVTAVMVLGIGVAGGFATYQNLYQPTAPSLQLASTAEIKTTTDEQTNKASVTLIDQSDDSIDQSHVSAPSQSIKQIGDNVESGVLLLPQGSINASAEAMFSDGVKILTAEDGTKMVVRVDEDGVPTGEVIPFVNVPVINESNN